RETPPPAAVPACLAQHRHGHVECQHFGIRIALLEQRRATTGSGADVDHPLRRVQIEVQPLQQARLHFTLQHVVQFVARGSRGKMAPDGVCFEMEITHALTGSSNGCKPATTASAWPMKGAWPARATHWKSPPLCCAAQCMA